MKKFVNGEYFDMTAEEVAAMQEASAKAEIEEKRRPLSLGEVQEMMVRAQINTLAVDDATALRMVAYYPEWTAGTAYAVGDRLVYNGDLYTLHGEPVHPHRRAARRDKVRPHPVQRQHGAGGGQVLQPERQDVPVQPRHGQPRV